MNNVKNAKTEMNHDNDDSWLSMLSRFNGEMSERCRRRVKSRLDVKGMK